jgi:hypothetical protein
MKQGPRVDWSVGLYYYRLATVHTNLSERSLLSVLKNLWNESSLQARGLISANWQEVALDIFNHIIELDRPIVNAILPFL